MFAESAARLEHGLAISPEDMRARVYLGFCRYLQLRFREALTISELPARRELTAWLCYQMALAHLQLGERDEAEERIEQGTDRFPDDVLFHPLRGLLAALSGDRPTARRMIELTEHSQRSFVHYHHAQYDVACALAALGEKAEALDWLAAAARNGFPCHAFFERDPLLEPVRSEPGFEPLMAELRSECDGYRRLYQGLTES
jgi:tetratricopeptide (TPR) repeat protein